MTYVREYYLYVIGVVLGQVEVHYEPNVPPQHQVEADYIQAVLLTGIIFETDVKIIKG